MILVSYFNPLNVIMNSRILHSKQRKNIPTREENGYKLNKGIYCVSSIFKIK